MKGGKREKKALIMKQDGQHMILYKTKQKISNNAEKANQNLRKKQKVLEENENKINFEKGRAKMTINKMKSK